MITFFFKEIPKHTNFGIFQWILIQSQETFRALLNVTSMYSHFQDKQVELHRVYLETDIKYK